MAHLDFPYTFDGRGRTAGTDYESHVRDLVEQVLFTSPGERVNRPTFGCGLLQLVFEPNSPELATATQFVVQGALQEWLGDVIQVEAVEVTADDSGFEVAVAYVLLQTLERRVEQFSRGGVSP